MWEKVPVEVERELAPALRSPAYSFLNSISNTGRAISERLCWAPALQSLGTVVSAQAQVQAMQRGAKLESCVRCECYRVCFQLKDSLLQGVRAGSRRLIRG